jgi:hypothetical protein
VAWNAQRSAVADVVAQRRVCGDWSDVIGLQPNAARAAVLTAVVITREYGGPPLAIFDASASVAPCGEV